MSVLQVIMATAGSTVIAPPPPPPPPPTVTAVFDGDDTNRGLSGANGWWIVNNSVYAASLFSTTPATWNSVTYADGSAGHTYDFDGTQWMIGPGIGNQNTNELTINLWFYPTANNVQILSELGAQDISSGYHYSVFEIDASGYVHGRYWPNSAPGLSTANTVTLNEWNHIYFQQNSSGYTILVLNNGQANITTTTARQGPGTSYFAFGYTDTTSLVTTNAYQGKIGHFEYVNNSGTQSNYNALKSKYIPVPTSYSLGGANTIVGNSWNGSSIIGTYSTWPPGAVHAGTGVIMVNGTYLEMPVKLASESWTVQLLAELAPASTWATIFGSEAYFANTGYLAVFQNTDPGTGAVTDTLTMGSPNASANFALGANFRDRALWAFVRDGTSMTVYRNGVSVATSTGAAPTSVGNSNLLIGARHTNDGTGATDFCNLTLYYAKVDATPIAQADLAANYTALASTYGI